MENLGVLLFFAIAGLSFWVLIFLSLFIPYWISLWAANKFMPSKATVETEDEWHSSIPPR